MNENVSSTKIGKTAKVLCVYLSRLMGRAVKIRSAGGVDLHLKGWKKKEEYAEFSFSTAQTPTAFRLVYPHK